MAVIKSVSSKAAIGRAINYVTKEEKTDESLLSGLNCQPRTAKTEMEVTKMAWGKAGGRTYKHYVQSFAPGECCVPGNEKNGKVTTKLAHKIACEFARIMEQTQWKGFEVLIATHKDKKNIHTHFIVNSVNFEDGHKLSQSKEEYQNMKDESDKLCAKYGLHITEKGKTFDGKEREEVVAYRKDTYRRLKQAEAGEVKSYVMDIARTVLDCREKAESREQFISMMQEKGYGVDWQDSHKYITFTDLTRQEQGEKQCKVRNNKLEKYYNMDFGKEGLENEFEANARRNQEAERIIRAGKAELDRTIDREIKDSQPNNQDIQRKRSNAGEVRSSEAGEEAPEKRERDAGGQQAETLERERHSGKQEQIPGNDMEPEDERDFDFEI